MITIVFQLNIWLSFIIQFIRPSGVVTINIYHVIMSATNSSSAAEFEALLLRLGFSKAVVDFLSDEQGIKTVDDLKIIPVTQITSIYNLLSSAAAATTSIRFRWQGASQWQ
jgi:hypothetical protein